MTTALDHYFDTLYGSDRDPYGCGTRWYEARKRDVMLASLPRQRYARAYEPGCGVGETTVHLAARCDEVLASDFNPRAGELARRRTANLDNVKLERHALPKDWPKGSFDLIVLSELGYFLDEAAMQAVAAHCEESLTGGGTLVACNWRPAFTERALPTDAVHRALEQLGLARIVHHVEDDFLLDLWSRDARSVAQCEGIR
ncbi:MAG: class I SAM-dependent methyltransferase [Gammaproteobacteria bacterium]|nr:class I SAM-dependent methyltransferase [Gammaproteobacteria bacterium]